MIGKLYKEAIVNDNPNKEFYTKMICRTNLIIGKSFEHIGYLDSGLYYVKTALVIAREKEYKVILCDIYNAMGIISMISN